MKDASTALLCVSIIVALYVICRNVKNHLYYRKLLQTVTSRDRGTPSERKLVLQLLKFGIHPNAIFHDLYLRKRYNKFVQIDIVLATKVGIIVFEVKDYSGWIFGNGLNREWTQVLAYGKQKYTFYNPVMQNNRHIAELKKHDCFNGVPFYSIIVFDGCCKLRDINTISNGTLIIKPCRLYEVLNDILGNQKLAIYISKQKIVTILRQAVKNGQHKEVQKTHITNIQNLLKNHRALNYGNVVMQLFAKQF
jgi:hypothetical protein